jgi:phosphoribosylamine---glycine ligase
MKILVLGSGGREHAVVWKLKQSPIVDKIWCAPGNGGIAADAECVPFDLADVNAAAALAAQLHADLTVIGPELPLVLGVADAFAKRGLALLGPSAAAAQLEGSKIFAKQFMQRHKIPTAAVYGISSSSIMASQALDRASWPVVIKADGLCAGKGVVVTSERDDADAFIRRAMEQGEFGAAGKHLLIEEALRGEELSYIILTDGKHFIRMAPARDHKRAYDHDTGPNTGGMGAYSLDELLPPALEKTIIDTIVRPTLHGLQTDGISYRGFLYFGLMLTAEGPQILEYNCRLGDPETQAVLLRADFDFADACARAATGSLEGFDAKWFSGASACVVLASEGYPQHPATGHEITGLHAAVVDASSVVFHAGTRLQDHKFYSTGGRVLAVAAKAPELPDALRIIYQRISSIHLEGSFYRNDIGASARNQRAIAPC